MSEPDFDKLAHDFADGWGVHISYARDDLAEKLRYAYRLGAEHEREAAERYICTTRYHEDDLLAFIRARGKGEA